MKKHRLKIYLKLGILICGISLFVIACQKEDFSVKVENNQITNSNSKSQYLRDKDVPEYLVKYLGEKTDNTFRVNIQQGRIRLANANLYNRNTPLGVVQTNKVVEVVNENNIKYTFKVSDPTDSTSVVNLIVVDVDGEITEYFIQYLFDELQPPLRLESGAIDMTTFTGRMLFYDYVGLLIGDYDFTDGVNTTSTGETNPCPPDDDDTDSTNDTTDSDDDTTNTSSGTTSNSDGTNTNSGATSGGDSGSVETYAPADCGLTWSYESCGCGGSANGHEPQGVSCCQGSPLVVTDTCTGQSWSSRNNTSSRDDLSLDPCAGGVGVILDDEECLANITQINQALGNSLTPEVLNCISQDCQFVDDALNFLNTNPTETEFMQQAAQSICDGGDVDFEDNIIYTINKDCQEQIVKDIIGVSSPLTDLINNTFDVSENVNVKFWNGTLENPNAAAKTNPNYYGSPDDFIISIGFNDTFLDSATDLAIVAVTLHELIHAYHVNLYITGQLLATDENYETLLNAFIDYYADPLINYDVHDIEMHNAMESFMTEIGRAIYNYAQINNIENVDLQYCVALAWGTMYGNQLFEEALTTDQQTHAGNILATEYDNTEYATSYPIKGTPCD